MADKKESVQRLRDAQAALDANAARERADGVTQETAEYLRLNRAVAEAEADVAWVRR